MADSIVGSVIEYLADDDDTLRDISLNWLCEGYLDDPAIARTVFDQWDSRNPESAFAQFPMLSFFPVPVELLDEACQRAADMALQGRELTHPTTRCAGKLLEQIVRLPASHLQTHFDRIAQVVRSHKIFFRVDLDALQNRMNLLSKSSDELCEQLDRSIEALTIHPEDRQALQEGQHALEALRANHPDTLNLAAALSQVAAEDRPIQPSLQLSLLSLSQFAYEQPLESPLAPLLHSTEPTALNLSIESLVRSGSGDAAQVLLEQFPAANENNRRWIARGLQRMRVHNLAPLIAQLRSRVSDNTAWIMLLVAEMQQLDPASSQRMIEAWNELDVVNPTVVDAGMLYTFVCSPFLEQDQSSALETGYRDFLLRVQSGLEKANPESTKDVTATDEQSKRGLRRQRGKQIDQLFNKRHRL